MNKISARDLHAFARALLQGGGFTAEEAELTAESLVLSNLKGYDSHGVVRVAEYIGDLRAGVLTSGRGLSVMAETANACTADAQRGLGQVQMPRFLALLAAKAEKNGVVSGALRDCGHVGRLGEWVEYLAARGFAAFAAVNDNGALHAVAPPGGKQGRTSTNPIAFGIPLAGGAVFALDMSTSATALGKVRLAHMSGETLAPGLVQDAEGHATTDPAAMFGDPRGALLPLGGHKGFGLAMMADCLVAGLSGGFAPPAPAGAPLLNNAVITIWNPALFSGLSHMQAEAEKYLSFVRAAAPIDPQKPVRVPGDRAGAEQARREKDGIPLGPGTIKALRAEAERQELAIPAAFN